MATDRRGALIPLLIITWIILSPSPQHDHRAVIGNTRPKIEDAIAEEQHSLEVLNNSTYEASRFKTDINPPWLGLNLTGFEEDRTYAWDAWPHIRGLASQSTEWWQRAIRGDAIEPRPVPLYENVTGYVQGRWARQALPDHISTPSLNLTAYAPENPFGPVQPRDFQGNVSGDAGDVQIKLTQSALAGATLGVPGNITEMKVKITLWDDAIEHNQIQLRGVYFTEAAFGLVSTTSDKFAGIFALPHLMPNDYTFNLSRTVLNESISKTIARQISRDTTSLHPWTTSTAENNLQDPFVSPQCELIVWLQQEEPVSPPAQRYSTGFLAFLERELKFPTGAFLPPVPEMRFRMTAFSPDCGYIITSAGPPTHSAAVANHLTGPKMPVQSSRGLHAVLLYTGILGIQVLLLLRQMREASTPSTRSRISFYTIAGMALGDGFVTLSFCTLGTVLDGLSLNLMAAGFVGFSSMLFFGMRFLIDIWAVHAPELRRRERVEVRAELRRREEIMAELRAARERRAADATAAAAAAAAAATPTTQEGVSDVVITTEAAVAAQVPAQSTLPHIAEPAPTEAELTLPLPFTAARPLDTGATPTFYMPSDQAGLLPAQQAGLMPIAPLTPLTEDQTARLTEMLTDARVPSFASMYIRFFVLLIALVFLSLNAAGWPSIAQKIYYTAIAFLYLSFWIPQIHRNARRNCRRAFEWEFVLGQAALRLTPFVYFYAYPKNIIFARPDYIALAVLATWQWLQVLTLLSQAFLGPRWFLPASWMEPAYDYHPILRADAEDSTLPLGFTPSSPLAARRGSLPAKPKADDSNSVGRGKRLFDCAICMQDLEVPVVEADGGEDGGLGTAGWVLARMGYMVTPCRHVFHTGCLEGWMKYRLQCPVCREGLPTL
ncbi:hypothetical protein LTR95_007165 [Oleoguttula sp. CCFEE 5521]